MQKLSVRVDFRQFVIVVVYSAIKCRTGISQVDKKRHLGLARKNLLLHSLKNDAALEFYQELSGTNYENMLNQE